MSQKKTFSHTRDKNRKSFTLKSAAFKITEQFYIFFSILFFSHHRVPGARNSVDDRLHERKEKKKVVLNMYNHEFPSINDLTS